MASGREEIKMAANRTCDSCQKNQAELFCACTKARTYLCRGCAIDHAMKYPHLVHQLICADIDVPNVSEYRERSEIFAATSAELEQNLTRIDQCCQEVTTAFNTVIELLEQWRNYYVRSLQEWKVTVHGEIEEAENEVRNSLTQDSVKLKCKYSPLLRYYQSGPLQLFTYEINTSGFDDLARNAVKFQYMEVPKPEAFEAPIERPQAQVCTSSPLPNIREKPASMLDQELQVREQEAARLNELARSKLTSRNYAEALELCAAADAIYSRLFPENIGNADNLGIWGFALMNMKKNPEAVAKYAAANAIYYSFFPDSINYATNLTNWGKALENMGKSAEAMVKYVAADAIYSRFFPDDINNAHNLGSWGQTLMNIGKNVEAVVKYAAANAIYSRLFSNDISNAINLYRWGQALINMGKKAEAVRKLKDARTVYASLGMTDFVRMCDSEIATQNKH